jgi:hypothetical protein
MLGSDSLKSLKIEMTLAEAITTIVSVISAVIAFLSMLFSLKYQKQAHETVRKTEERRIYLDSQQRVMDDLRSAKKSINERILACRNIITPALNGIKNYFDHQGPLMTGRREPELYIKAIDELLQFLNVTRDSLPRKQELSEVLGRFSELEETLKRMNSFVSRYRGGFSFTQGAQKDFYAEYSGIDEGIEKSAKNLIAEIDNYIDSVYNV